MLVSLNIKMLSTSTLLYARTGQSESVLCQGEERETHRKGKKRERVKAIMQVAGTNGSYQKMWLVRLKVVTLI